MLSSHCVLLYLGSLPTPVEAHLPIELSIIMPCLNEAETLEACIRKAKDYLDRSGVAGEIVVGDNGSTDVLRKSPIAVERGSSRFRCAVTAPLSTPPPSPLVVDTSSWLTPMTATTSPIWIHFSSQLRQGYDLVMGNRFRGGIKPGAMPWKNRYIGNPILSAIGKTFFRCPANDFHCGIRGYSKDAFLRMDLHTTGMEFASEMVIKATMMRMKICEVPTMLSPDGRSRPPHLRPYRDGWRHLRFMLLFSPNWLFLYPGLLLLLVGAGGHCVFVVRPGPHPAPPLQHRHLDLLRLHDHLGVSVGTLCCSFPRLCCAGTPLSGRTPVQPALPAHQPRTWTGWWHSSGSGRTRDRLSMRCWNGTAIVLGP